MNDASLQMDELFLDTKFIHEKCTYIMDNGLWREFAIESFCKRFRGEKYVIDSDFNVERSSPVHQMGEDGDSVSTLI